MERSKYVFIFSKSSGILEHKITYLKGAILNILVLIPMYFRRNDKSLRLTLLSFVNMRSPPLYMLSKSVASFTVEMLKHQQKSQR